MIYEWLIAHTDSLVAAANFTAVVFLLLLCVVALTLLTRDTIDPESDIRIILWGVVVETFAWALHRGYWGSWRLAREYGYEDWNQWFVVNGWIAIIPSLLVLTGLAMILSPLWRYLASPIGVHKRSMDYYIPAGLIVGTYILLWTWIEDDLKVNGSKPNTLEPIQIERMKHEERHGEGAGGIARAPRSGIEVPPPVRRSL